jgi:hypothetical protein
MAAALLLEGCPSWPDIAHHNILRRRREQQGAKGDPAAA